MKEGLIRITGEDNIFYDSVERIYRYRMHCPECNKLIPTCRCYQNIDDLMNDINDEIADYTCSSKCVLLYGEWNGSPYIDDVLSTLGISPDAELVDLTEEQAAKVLEILIDAGDFDMPGGEECGL